MKYLLKEYYGYLQRQYGSDISQLFIISWNEHWCKNRLSNALKKRTGVFSDHWDQIAEAETTAMINIRDLEQHLQTREGIPADRLYVYFLVVHDRHLCDMCSTLHMTKHGIPRVYTLKEILLNSHGEWDENMTGKLSPRGPHFGCRCGIALVPDGWGFRPNSDQLHFISPDYNEYENQRTKDKEGSPDKGKQR